MMGSCLSDVVRLLAVLACMIYGVVNIVLVFSATSVLGAFGLFVFALIWFALADMIFLRADQKILSKIRRH